MTREANGFRGAYRERGKARTVGRLTEAQENLIRLRYQQGEGTVLLGRAFGVDPKTIARVLKDVGIKMRTRQESQTLRGQLHRETYRRHYTYDLRSTALRRYREGATLEQVASELGVSVPWVQKLVSAEGFTRSNRGAQRLRYTIKAGTTLHPCAVCGAPVSSRCAKYCKDHRELGKEAAAKATTAANLARWDRWRSEGIDPTHTDAARAKRSRSIALSNHLKPRRRKQGEQHV